MTVPLGFSYQTSNQRLAPAGKAGILPVELVTRLHLERGRIDLKIYVCIL